MTNWKCHLDLKDEWLAAKNGNISPYELAQKVVVKIKQLECYESDEELQEIVEDFEVLPPDCDVEDFDDVMEALYDWGDTDVSLPNQWPPNKMCWITAAFLDSNGILTIGGR